MRSASTTSLSGSGNGSGRSNTPSTIEKIAVVAPMPSASINTAVSVNAGDFNNFRIAIFRSRVTDSIGPRDKKKNRAGDASANILRDISIEPHQHQRQGRPASVWDLTKASAA